MLPAQRRSSRILPLRAGQTIEDTRATADIQDPLTSLHPGQIGELGAELGRIPAHETVVGGGCDVSNVAVAFAWLLEQPGVTPIAGPSKPHHMEAIEQALDLDLPDDDLQQLTKF